jgi:hypothetical protein
MRPSNYTVLIGSRVSDTSHSDHPKLQANFSCFSTIAMARSRSRSRSYSRSPSPYVRRNHRSRSRSPPSRPLRRDRDLDRSPTRGHANQQSQANRSQPLSDSIIKALNDKNKKGRQGRERYFYGYMRLILLLMSYTRTGMGRCRSTFALER